jgi:hypothetical protein
MSNLLKYWKKINRDLFVIRAEGLEDFRAVVGSKTSRATDLSIRADIDSEGLEKFLTMNLAGYGHASIGEMSFPSVHHRGIGWIAAWLIEDDPLFIGQEVSTRAVDVRKIPDGDEPCYDAPNNLKDQNRLFWNIFDELNKRNELNKGYKFDNIRWAMPGTARVGVTYMMNARTAIRHLERLESINFMKQPVENIFEGIKECTPFVYNALRKGPRKSYRRWTNIDTFDINYSLDFNNSISIEAPKNLEEALKEIDVLDNRGDRDYLDSIFNRLGLFKFSLICSVAAARDWHRHRPMMPWTISLVTKNGYPFIAPWYDLKEYSNDVNEAIKKGYSNTKDIESIQKLYSLPYGTAVKIEGYGTLPNILYMLELRASAGGSNFEYANHGIAGLKKLVDILDKNFVKNQSIDRVLKRLK